MSPPLPPPARKDFERAVSLFQQGRLATAEGVCAELLARHPRDSEVAYFGGVLANRMGHYDLAVQRLTRCVQAEPRRAKAHAALGLAYEQLGRLDEAIGSFTSAVRADPRFSDARNGLGVALFRAGRFEDSVSSFDAAIALDPKAVEARMNRARALRKLGRDPQAARSWGEALELGAGRDDVRRMCALGLLESGDRPAAIKALREHLERAPQDALARSQLALALEADGHPGEALVEIERAQGSSSAPEVLSARGTVLMRLGRFDEALAAFDATEAASSSSPETRVNQALVLKSLGRRAEALAKMREAEDGLDARGMTQLAAMYLAMDGSEKAMALLERALAEAPDLAEAYSTRAFERLRRGELEPGWREHLYRPTRGRAILERIAARSYPPPLPDPLEGAHIAIRAEQGLGDVLFFLRYAAPLAAAGAKLTLAGIDARLRPMVSR
ncbi:MAG TPA: tetratricopeptide repeat protein, partial [Usitatibacter sp.]|nr:tetratricopeptide repeat protein [Usitatibacter sp.]